MSEGRVLSDYDVLITEEQLNSACEELNAAAIKKIPDLIATIRDRDRQIAELLAISSGTTPLRNLLWAADKCGELQKQNAIMCEALEWYADKFKYSPPSSGRNSFPIDADGGLRARDTLAKLDGDN